MYFTLKHCNFQPIWIEWTPWYTFESTVKTNEHSLVKTIDDENLNIWIKKEQYPKAFLWKIKPFFRKKKEL